MTNKDSYFELYKRNSPIIDNASQSFFRNMRVAVAGCGSTGGAFIEGMVRLGIETFHLSDNGSYELNNLNRQMVFLSDLGVHKAEAHQKRIKNVNSNATVKIWTDGVHEQNLPAFLNNIDFLFDAVDVTTPEGIKAKLELHFWAHKLQIPTGSALDLGFTQWLQSYNYHEGDALLLGKFTAAKACQHPLKALIAGWSPIEDLPLEIIEEILRLIKFPQEGACQLGSACFALSAMVTPYLSYFAKKGRLPGLTALDLLRPFLNEDEKTQREAERTSASAELEKVLRQLQ